MENSAKGWELKIGDECWIQYSKGIYEGFENGKHKVRIQKSDGYEVKEVLYPPLINDFEPKPFYKDKNGNIFVYLNEMTCWYWDTEVQMRYYFKIPSDVFREKEYLSRKEIIAMTPIDNPFLSEKEIQEKLSIIDDKISPLNNQIKEIKSAILELEEEKKPIYSSCCHKWFKGEEIEGKMGMLGKSCSQECECEICGMKKTNYYTRL